MNRPPALRVAVDFGTSSTCVAVSVDGREPQVANVDGRPLISSAVFAAPDGALFVGQEAERQAAIDPARYEPHPKRRIDEGELLLGDRVLPVQDVVAAVLRRAVGEARRFAGGRGVDLLVLTHPANWGSVRTRTLQRAGAGLANRLVLVPEPVAAAVFHAAGHAMPTGHALAVLDLGGGTVDVSVVRRTASGSNVADGAGVAGAGVAGFDVLATAGDPNFGGADIDQVLLQHIGSLVGAEHAEQWRALQSGRELADRRRRRTLHADVRSAKETLSRHAYTDVPLPPPLHDAHVTRGDFERLVSDPLRRTAELVASAVTESGVPRERLAGVFLVGGSSRIPRVARLVHERLGIIPVTLDQPETVVARGALRAVTFDPEHTGGYNTAGYSTGGYNTGGFRGQPPRAAAQPGPPGGAGGGQQARQPGQAGGQQPPRFAPAPRAGAQAGVVPAGTRQAGPHTTPPGPQAPATTKSSWAKWLFLTVVTVLGFAFVGLLTLFIIGSIVGDDDKGGGKPAPQAGARRLSVYDYTFELPKGWQQGGGSAKDKQTTIFPRESSTTDNGIAVQEFTLDRRGDGPNSNRFARELKTKLDRLGGYSDFDPDARFVGRDVLYYRGSGADGKARTDWYVLVRNKIQVSVGCQYTPPWKDRVGSACRSVVRSLRIRGG